MTRSRAVQWLAKVMAEQAGYADPYARYHVFQGTPMVMPNGYSAIPARPHEVWAWEMFVVEAAKAVDALANMNLIEFSLEAP